MSSAIYPYPCLPCLYCLASKKVDQKKNLRIPIILFVVWFNDSFSCFFLLQDTNICLYGVFLTRSDDLRHELAVPGHKQASKQFGEGIMGN